MAAPVKGICFEALSGRGGFSSDTPAQIDFGWRQVEDVGMVLYRATKGKIGKVWCFYGGSEQTMEDHWL